LIVDFHDGLLVIGNSDDRPMVRRYLLHRLHAAVCTVGYRLAPEHAFPSAPADALDALIALLDGKVDPRLQGRYDTKRVALFGYGAGGYLVGLTMLHLAELGRNVSAHIYHAPMVQPYLGTISALDYGEISCYSSDMIRWAWTVFLRGDTGHIAASQHVNPLLAAPSLLARLPPAYVIVHSLDPFRDEGREYARLLQEAGKLLRLDEFSGTHCITGMSGTHLETILDRVVAFLAEAFALPAAGLPRQAKRRFRFLGFEFSYWYKYKV
jgi:acetyl esterase